MSLICSAFIILTVTQAWGAGFTTAFGKMDEVKAAEFNHFLSLIPSVDGVDDEEPSLRQRLSTAMAKESLAQPNYLDSHPAFRDSISREVDRLASELGRVLQTSGVNLKPSDRVRALEFLVRLHLATGGNAGESQKFWDFMSKAVELAMGGLTIGSVGAAIYYQEPAFLAMTVALMWATAIATTTNQNLKEFRRRLGSERRAVVAQKARSRFWTRVRAQSYDQEVTTDSVKRLVMDRILGEGSAARFVCDDYLAAVTGPPSRI